MRTIISFAFALFVTCGCASAQPAPGAEDSAAPLAQDSSIDEVLDALDRRGEQLKEFSADVKLTETDNSTALSSMRGGKIWYQARDGDPRMRIMFDTKEDDTRTYKEKVEYALADGWLVDRDYKRRIEVRRQVVRPGQKINLLKLGEGPFPLPIGQDKEDVYELFDVTKPDPADTDPQGMVHIALKPKEGTRLAKKFSLIDLWVDQQNHMLRKIEATDANESLTRTTEFDDIKINPEGGLPDSDLAPAPLEQQEWDLHEEPFEE